MNISERVISTKFENMATRIELKTSHFDEVMFGFLLHVFKERRRNHISRSRSTLKSEIGVTHILRVNKSRERRFKRITQI